jgi:oxygen-independent coproporphyrinogen-3 oxidase
MAGGAPLVPRLLDAQTLIFEFFLNRLRLREAFSAADFTRVTSLSWDTVSNRVQEAVERGLVDEIDGQYATSELGWRFLNDTQQIFLP